MKSGASSLNPTPLDDMASVSMTPALEAETELLLSQRTRDIRFSPEMVRAYRKKDWPQRSKIARAWMVWVAMISMAFVPISFLLAPNSLWLTCAISGLLVPALHACAYLVWRKPRAAAVEGLSLILLMSSVMIAYGFLAVAAGGSDYERFLTCIMYVNTIAIVVFNVDYVWSLCLMASSTVIFFGFEIFNPAIDLEEAVGTTVFYAMGIYAATIARKTQSILGSKSLPAVLAQPVSQRRAERRESSVGNTGDTRPPHRARQSPFGQRPRREALARCDGSESLYRVHDGRYRLVQAAE